MPGTVKALTNVVAYEIAQESFATLRHERPSMADELGILLTRRSGENTRHTEKASETSRALTISRLTDRIRQLFDL